ncbi:hypothetical protein GGI42DRAFT_254673 [Trichoderma sp. SZMC 28013]
MSRFFCVRQPKTTHTRTKPYSVPVGYPQKDASVARCWRAKRKNPVGDGSLQGSTAARSVMVFKTVLGDSPVLVSSPGSTCSSSIPEKATRIAFPGNGGQSVEHDRGCASFRPIPYRAAAGGTLSWTGHGSRGLVLVVMATD